MGAETKAIIKKSVSIEAIKNALTQKYGDVDVQTSESNSVWFAFKDENDTSRFMFLFFETNSLIEGNILTLCHNKAAINIMKYLCETFGGYLLENDCNDKKDFYPINFNLFQRTEPECAKIDLFKNKIIAEIGYDKLETVLELFEQFKELSINEINNNN
jgi:hypothetical protein